MPLSADQARTHMLLQGPRTPGLEQRLSVDGDGLIVLELKRAFTDATTHVLFEPADVYVGCGEALLRKRQAIKRKTLEQRRLHHGKTAA